MFCWDRSEPASDRSPARIRTRSAHRVALWLLLFFTTSLFCIESTQAEPVAIIHRDEAHTKTERKILRAAFSMTLQVWPDGRPVTVFVFRDDDPVHQQFCRKVLGVLPYTLRRNWDRLLFSGAAQAPIAVDTSQEMLYRVATTPGAIGYIEKELSNDSVSIVEIAE